MDGETNDGGSGTTTTSSTIPQPAQTSTPASSIRSKKTAKKMNIRWKDSLRKWRRVPIFDTAKEEKEAVQNQLPGAGGAEPNLRLALKSNTSMATSGGLGSYTPSKIQMTETPSSWACREAGPRPSTAAFRLGPLPPDGGCGPSFPPGGTQRRIEADPPPLTLQIVPLDSCKLESGELKYSSTFYYQIYKK